jgi:hypothetical protein
MSKPAALALGAILLTTAVAHADTSDSGPKNPDAALMLSLGGTAASAAVFAAGLKMHNSDMEAAGAVSSMFTPSLGEWYAGKPLTAGMGIRALSVAVGVAGIGEALSCWGDSCSTGSAVTASVLVLGGLAGYAAGTIYDIADAPSSARAYNRNHSWQVTPTVLRTPSGDTHMGVGIGGSF